MQVTARDGEPRPAERVTIETRGVELAGELALPSAADAIVVLAHAGGSVRFDAMSRDLARMLRDARLGTLLLDLLAPHEAGEKVAPELAFDVGELTARLLDVARWLSRQPACRGAKLGILGTGNGAAAAMVAAARRPRAVSAIVSRAGRPDLAGDALGKVRAPTLLVVGEKDVAVTGLNRLAFDRLQCEKKLEIVPGASHLFDEEGALESVAARASEWFRRHLAEPS